MLQTLTAGTALQPEFCLEGTPRRLPPTIENNLLRISQEALTNTLRYAQAQTLHLTLSFEPQAVTLHLYDDGEGFDQGQATAGFGLLGMRPVVTAP
jgi:signal transduction histidine kinase